MVNLHFSLLPRWRGAAPVERAILAGDDRTGVCVMDVAEGLDTGAVHAVAEVPIDDRVTAAELTATLAVVGADLLVAALADGLGRGTPQADDGVTYARKITAEDRHLDWARTAVELQRVVRIGGAWTTFRGARLKVLGARVVDAPDAGGADAGAAGGTGAPGHLDGTTVRCGDGGLELLQVQPEGKAPMDAEAWRNGARPEPSERLGDDGPGAAAGG
jgi:methionyl-tRNA formyltransferase